MEIQEKKMFLERRGLRTHLSKCHGIKLASDRDNSKLTLTISSISDQGGNIFENVKTKSSNTKLKRDDSSIFNKDVLIWFVVDMQPFSTVNDDGFRYFLTVTSRNKHCYLNQTSERII